MAEQVIKLEADFFDPEPNVACPVLVQSEHSCFLIYTERNGKRSALEFHRATIAMFGYPNDHALGGHRLYAKGLGCYDTWEVMDSEWIAALRDGNRVAFPEFDPLPAARHFVITFHDSTFECIARDFGPAGKFPDLDNDMLHVDESFITS